MSYHFPPELNALVQRQMAVGVFASEDEFLILAVRSFESQQEDWMAIQRSLDSLDSGEQGLSLEEAFDVVRQRHNIPADA